MKHHTVRLAAPVLALHLKRWPPNSPNNLIADVVEPPRTLIFADFTYHLRSVVLHRGATVAQGHYVALMHQPVSAGCHWWRYDDAERKAAGDTDLSTDETWKSYICFYEHTM